MDILSSAIDVLKKKVVFNSEDLWLAIWQLSDFQIQTLPEFVKAEKTCDKFSGFFLCEKLKIMFRVIFTLVQ